MNISNPANQNAVVPGASRSAIEGIYEQERRLERNVAEVAHGDNTNGFEAGSQNRALVQQSEIVRAVRANARSLEVANQVLGTIIDIKV